VTVTSLCLGLDVSPKRLGWALARLEDGAPVACGCESLDMTRTSYVEAFSYIWRAAAGANGSGEVHYIAMELPALPPKSGTRSAFLAGCAWQRAYDEAMRKWPWAVVDEMQPSEWRQLAGLKGNASKAEVTEHALDIGFDTYLNGGLVQDAADAACIALAGVERNRQTLATPAGQAAR
jgi:hypothetical protein